MTHIVRCGMALLLLMSIGAVAAADDAKAPVPKTRDAKPTGATSASAAVAANNIPEELVFLAKAEADAVIATGKPACAKGRMVLTFQPDQGFLEEGATFRVEEVGFAVGEAARAGKLSCLFIQAEAYDRAMFEKLRDDYAAPNGVSLMWIPKNP